jgi:hypothetical protein
MGDTLKYMKKITLASLVVSASMFLGTSPAIATVGGPTYVYDLKYDRTNASVYFTEMSESGRGCPPTLMKISLNSSETTTVISCDQTESLSTQEVESEIRGITANFKDLTSINLSKNSMKIDVVFVNEEKIANEDWVLKSHFMAKIYQNNILLAELPITGCSKDQPFTFGGYAIPGLNKKLILLLSTKGDCWEGGYTFETLRVINATILDRTLANNSYKTRGPLVPSEATLVVFEKDHTNNIPVITPTPTQPTTNVIIPEQPANNNSQLITALIVFAFTVLGVVLGYHIKR